MGCILDIPAERFALRVPLALQAAVLRRRRGGRIRWKYVVTIEVLAARNPSLRHFHGVSARTRAMPAIIRERVRSSARA